MIEPVEPEEDSMGLAGIEPTRIQPNGYNQSLPSPKPHAIDNEPTTTGMSSDIIALFCYSATIELDRFSDILIMNLMIIICTLH